MDPIETSTEVINQGGTLQKSGNEFTQAIAIQKPRQRQDVIKNCEEEAAIAGEEFYYSWTVKSKKGPVLVEGLSVGGALAAARNWGNCALPCSVEETKTHYVFTATFLDLETGFNMQRVFKQRKEQNIGMKDEARAEDITFQIGQSKALRNVALNAMPTWLTRRMLDKAKEQVIAKITKMGLPVARQKAMDFFEKHGIEIDRVEKKMAKNQTHWDAEDLAIIQGAMSSLVNGQESADSLFPEVNEQATVGTAKKTSALKEKIAAKKAAKEKPEPAKTEKSNKKQAEGPLKEEEFPPVVDPLPETSPDFEANETGAVAGDAPVNIDDLDTPKSTSTFLNSFNAFCTNNEVAAETVGPMLESLGYETGKIQQVVDDTPENQDIVLDYFKEELTIAPK
jgi:hypothetical protein